MPPLNPLDEFGSELASAESPRCEPLDEPLRSPTGPRQSIEPAAPSLASAPLLSLEEIVRREVAINWDEAVALVEEVCALSSPAETGSSEPIGPVHRRWDGCAARWRARAIGDQQCRPPAPLAVVNRRQHTGAAPPVRHPGQCAGYLREHRCVCQSTRLFWQTRSARADPRALPPVRHRRDFRPGDRTPSRAETRSPPAATPQPARSRPTLPRWAVATLAAMVLSAAVAWVWSMRSSVRWRRDVAVAGCPGA